ncbi:hypothetical protein FRB96_008231 [Tulasnella sp. 330]|nr:hypothetical protein FRB96_008231 [Tulasnella sp. 330]
MAVVQAQLPPWETQTFEFGWPGNQTDVTACTTIKIGWFTNPGAIPPPTSPYQVVVYREGYSPLVYSNLTGGLFHWSVNLPVGGPYMMSMNDAAGGTGGVAATFSVVASPDGETCLGSGITPASLAFNLNGPTTVCETIPITATGGTPPFKLTVLPDNSPPKTINYASGNFAYVLDVAPALKTFLLLQDSTGKSGVSQQFVVGSSTNTSCLTAAATLAPGSPALTTEYPGLSTTATTAATTSAAATSTGTHSSTKVAVIVGPTVAVLLALLAILILLLRRRKRRKAMEREDPELTPTRGPDEYPTAEWANLVADPYTPPRSADAQTSEFGGRVSRPTSYSAYGSYHAVPNDMPLSDTMDHRRHSGNSSAYSLHPYTDPFAVSPGSVGISPVVSLQAQAHEAEWNPYDPYDQQMMKKQPRMSGSSLPSGVGALHSNQMEMQQFGAHMYHRDVKRLQPMHLQLQGGPGTSSTTTTSTTVGNVGNPTTSNSSASPPPAKGAPFVVNQNSSEPPPPLYSERL